MGDQSQWQLENTRVALALLTVEVIVQAPVTIVEVAGKPVHTAPVLTRACASQQAVPKDVQQGDHDASKHARWKKEKEEKESAWR